MPLVSYPASDSDSNSDLASESNPNPISNPRSSSKKRKRPEPKQPSPSSVPAPSTPVTTTSIRPSAATELPPLPAAFLDLYAAPARLSTSDDPALHGGRKRGVPHVEGNWATHVYLEWHPSRTEHALLTRLLSTISSTYTSTTSSSLLSIPPPLTTLLTSPLSAPLPLHISLSAPIVLSTPQRSPFLTHLTAALRSTSVRPFTMRPTQLAWTPNFDQSRWFLVLRVERPGGDELNRLLAACNGVVVGGFGLAGLYCGGGGRGGGEEDNGRRSGSRGGSGGTGAGDKLVARKPKRAKQSPQSTEPTPDASSAFHISLAWRLSAPEAELKDALKGPRVEQVMSEVGQLAIGFDCVKVRIGRDVSVVKLGGGKGTSGAEEQDGWRERGILG